MSLVATDEQDLTGPSVGFALRPDGGERGERERETWGRTQDGLASRQSTCSARQPRGAARQCHRGGAPGCGAPGPGWVLSCPQVAETR